MLASGCFGLEIASDSGVCAIKIPLAVCTLNKQFNKMGYLTGVVALTQLPRDWEISIILGSGKSEYFSVVLIKLSTHVGSLLYSTDMVFTGHRLRLVRGLYSSWSRKWWLEHSLQSVVVAHANFGGVMSAIHLIAYRGMADSCFRPHGALAQTLAHTINPASIIWAPAINPLEPIETPPPRQPIVSGEIYCVGRVCLISLAQNSKSHVAAYLRPLVGCDGGSPPRNSFGCLTTRRS
jgi:hypothetical protein